jgi:hypothetical protein
VSRRAGRTGWLIVALAAAAAQAGAATGAAPRELRFEKLNRVYTDLVGELEPFAAGPISVHLASPRQVVTVRDHLARLTPLGGGRVDGSLQVDLLGKGELVADVDLAGSVQHLTDELILPFQRVTLTGTARLERIPGGYRVIAERVPAKVPVAVRSHLIDRIVSTCESASLLTLGTLDCQPLTEALERPAIPLPAAGREFFLADTDLTDADRAHLDELIAGR